MTPEEILTREGEHQRIRTSRYRRIARPNVLRLGIDMLVVVEAWPDWLSPSALPEPAPLPREGGR